MTTPKIAFAAWLGGYCFFTWCELEPVLALRLKEFNLNQVQIGLFFAIMTVGSMLAGVAVQYHP